MDVFTIWNSNQINLHHGFIMIVSINVAGKKRGDEQLFTNIKGIDGQRKKILQNVWNRFNF